MYRSVQPRASWPARKEAPKVRSLLKDWSQWSRQTIRLLRQGSYAVYRRLSPHRSGRSETRVRPSGKTRALGRRGPSPLFDIQRSPNCHARRRENPDDERPAASVRVIELYSLRGRSSCSSRNSSRRGLPPVPVPDSAVELAELALTPSCTWSGTASSRCPAHFTTTSVAHQRLRLCQAPLAAQITYIPF